eukprot:jgi/Chrzof1/8985/Cz03g31270.t1
MDVIRCAGCGRTTGKPDLHRAFRENQPMLPSPLHCCPGSSRLHCMPGAQQVAYWQPAHRSSRLYLHWPSAATMLHTPAAAWQRLAPGMQALRNHLHGSSNSNSRLVASSSSIATVASVDSCSSSDSLRVKLNQLDDAMPTSSQAMSHSSNKSHLRPLRRPRCASLAATIANMQAARDATGRSCNNSYVRSHHTSYQSPEPATPHSAHTLARSIHRQPAKARRRLLPVSHSRPCVTGVSGCHVEGPVCDSGLQTASQQSYIPSVQVLADQEQQDEMTSCSGDEQRFPELQPIWHGSSTAWHWRSVRGGCVVATMAVVQQDELQQPASCTTSMHSAVNNIAASQVDVESGLSRQEPANDRSYSPKSAPPRRFRRLSVASAAAASAAGAQHAPTADSTNTTLQQQYHRSPSWRTACTPDTTESSSSLWHKACTDLSAVSPPWPNVAPIDMFVGPAGGFTTDSLDEGGLSLMWVAAHQPRGPGTTAYIYHRPCIIQTSADGSPVLRSNGDVVLSQLTAIAAASQQQQQPVVAEGLTFSRGGSSSSGWSPCRSSSSTEVADAATNDADTATHNVAPGHGSTDPVSMHHDRVHGSIADGAVAGGTVADGTASHLEPSVWYSYLIAVQGDFSMHEDETMFPNKVMHLADNRVAWNLRHGQDLAEFLAQPQAEVIRAHAVNLVRCAQTREHWLPPEWCLKQLHVRWGSAACKELGVDLQYVIGLGL